MSTFSSKEFLRYSRHIQLPQVGAEGQKKLKNAHLLIVGCGGLGAPVSLYLAAAGVGRISLVDGDSVELSNLQRQITFTESDIGKNKAQCTANALQARNSDIDITAIPEHLSAHNVDQLISQADIIMDCTDSVATRYLINDSCHKHNKPWVYASVFQFSGQCATFMPGKACYRCLFPNASSQAVDCGEAGVLGVLPGILGTIQAGKAIDLILQNTQSEVTRLYMLEAAELDIHSVDFQPSKTCAVCNSSSNSAEAVSTESDSTTQEALPIHDIKESSIETNNITISCAEFDKKITQAGVIVIDVRDIAEHNAFNLGNLCATHLHKPSSMLIEGLRLNAEEFDKGKQYLLYCQIGKRSALACEAMRNSGYNALSLSGGLQDFLQKGMTNI